MTDLTLAVTVRFGVGVARSTIPEDVTADIKSRRGIKIRYGIMGNNPYDRIAGIGTCEFALDNSASNSAGLVGYYSPDHASKRSGFSVGNTVSFYLSRSGGAYSKKLVFNISEIEPSAGVYGDHETIIQGEDYISQILTHTLETVDVQTQKRGDEVATVVLGDIAYGDPPTYELDTTPDIFAYSMDEGEGNTTALRALQRIVQSDGSLLYIKKNNTLKLESRNVRCADITDLVTLTDTMTGIKLQHSNTAVYNDIIISFVRRRVDEVEVVLWSLATEIELQPMETLTLITRFSDPDNEAERVSLYPGTGVDPIADIDYRMSSIANNSDGDITSDLTITTEWNSSGAELTLQNGNTKKVGFINLLQLRGYGMYLYDKQEVRVSDATSIDNYGRRALQFNLPYQSDMNVIKDIADVLLNRYKTPRTFVQSVEINGAKSTALLDAALQLDISSRLKIQETVSGVNASYLVNSVEYQIDDGKYLRATFGLVPANNLNPWILGNATYSVLDSTTRLVMFV